MNNDKKMKVEIQNVTQPYVYKSGSFTLSMNLFETSHELHISEHDNNPPTKPKLSEPHNWLVMDRGDSVAVILYKSDTEEIVLVQQFRAATLKYSQTDNGFSQINDGQLIETIAGIPEQGQTNEECAIKETLEETHYHIKNPELISTFYVSPGGSSERIFLYYAVVTEKDREPTDYPDIGGTKDENIKVLHIPVKKFFSEIISPYKAVDSKVMIASMLLPERLKNIPGLDAMQTAEYNTILYQLKNDPQKIIGLKTGAFENVEDVDVWVNSENTMMEMDRTLSKSISGYIHYAGAKKDSNNNILEYEDTVSDALKKHMRNKSKVPIGTVFDTTPGDLTATHNVKRIFHVAAVSSENTKGIKANLGDVRSVTVEVLTKINQRSLSCQFERAKYKSALLPMIAAGEGGLSTHESLPEIVRGIIHFFKQAIEPDLSTVYINAYRFRDEDIAIEYLRERDDLVRITQ